MDHMRRAARAACLFFSGLLAAAGAQAGQPAPKLPVEAFGALPAVRSVSLSSDGQKAAMLVNSQGNTTILVQELGKQNAKRTSLMSTDNKQYSFNWFRWVGNNRLLVGTIFPSKRKNGASAVGGVPTYETRLLAANTDTGQVVNLLKPDSFKGELQAQFHDRVIDFDVDGGKHVLLALADQEGSIDPVVYSLDVETGSRRHVYGPRQDFDTWMVDRNHQVRLGVYRDKLKVEIHACDPDGRNWRKLWSYEVLDKDSVSPLGFGKDPNELYLLADNNGYRALFTVDLRDPSLARKLKLAAKDKDLGGRLVYSKKTGEAIGLQGTSNLGQAELNFWDADRRELISFIDQALPKRFNTIVSMSDDETRYVLHSSSDSIPGEFYLGDDRANTLGLLAQNYPSLNAKDMAHKQQVAIKVRDGLQLPGYLTLPIGVEPKNLPLVLLVHGGPQSSDSGDFDTWPQFLANRGYAVLQVNFRGSAGFGHELMSAGLKRWGQEMQDDLTDATRWAIARGTADPKRICIVGGSYGGYAALMGAARTPDLYRCAFSFAGVTDVYELGRDLGNYRGKEVFDKQIGSLDLERDRLKANSPVSVAKQIKVPVLLMHGTQDRSVAFYQGTIMDEALTTAGVQHRFIKQDLGDHHLSIYQHRMQFFTELESFLAENLGTVK
jgi:dienelactone hydrolase